MIIDEKIINRLTELTKKGEMVLKTYKSGIKQAGDFVINGKNTVDSQIAYEWGTSCLNILAKVFGKESEHYRLFNSVSNDFENHKLVLRAYGVLNAAKNDYENGHLFDIRALIEAEVFDDFLEQSEHLLNQGYFTAAAVIAGSVLEDGLRKLCVKNGITLSAKPKLDSMNADLAKAGVYNLLKQKQITALADLRNKAAHGQGGFTKEDVEAMIKDVRRFMADYFS